MRATVDIGEEHVPSSYETSTGGWFKKKEVTHYTAHYQTITVLLELTEEERSTIIRYKLQDEVLENIPKYTEEQLANMFESSNPNLKGGALEMWEQNAQELKAQHRAERNILTISDLLAQPYKKQFGGAQVREAAEFADKMKTKFLPRVGALLKQHADVPKSETLEF